MAKGWICLHRSIMENWIWLDDEAFDKRSAWIDLLLMANHEDKKMHIDGSLELVKRGSKVTSIRQLSQRRRWSRGKVKRFLDLLQQDNMIEYETDHQKMTYTICNYNVYQDINFSDGPATGQWRATEKSEKEHKTDESGKKAGHQKAGCNPVSDKLSGENNFSDGPVTGQQRATDGPPADTNNNEINNDNNDDDISFHFLIQKWNSLDKNISKVTTINPGTQRYKLLRARLNEFGQETVLKAIDNISQSQFLQGYNKSGWTITFDRFLKPSNFQKVLDGNYTDRSGRQKTKIKENDPEFEEALKRIEREAVYRRPQNQAEGDEV